MEPREVKIHGIYRHFKNKYYIVEDAYNRKAVKKKLPVASFLGLSKNMAREINRAVAYHSETKEEYVVYRRLYDDNSLWIREKQMFLSEVNHEKYPDVNQRWRFELVEEVGK